jgi:hypothetical protein
MKTWVRKTLSVGVLAAGALLFAPGAAQADVHQSTGDNNGILNGTQIAVPVTVPVNIVGNSLGILGVANAQGVGVNHTESTRDRQSTGNNNGILNGTQAYLPVSVPVNVVGNSAAVLGHAQATGVGVNGVRGRKAESARTTEHGWPGNGGQSTGHNNGILNGTQLYAPIDVPINVCGNSLAVLGGSYSSAICANGSWGHGVRHQGGTWKKESVRSVRGGWQSTGDNNGIANGTQLYAPISLPVNLAGNSVAVLGSAGSRAVAVNEKGHRDGFGQSTGHNNGILNGTQIAAPISIPINVCGNSLGILGAAHSAAACVNHVDGGGFFGGDDDDWDGNHGGGHGHGPGHGNGGNNGADDDDDYKGDGGADKDDDGADKDDDGYGNKDDEAPAADGYGGAQDADNDYDTKKDEPTGGRKGKAEASPVAGLTETFGGVSDNTGLGSLSLLNTLR